MCYLKWFVVHYPVSCTYTRYHCFVDGNIGNVGVQTSIPTVLTFPSRGGTTKFEKFRPVRFQGVQQYVRKTTGRPAARPGQHSTSTSTSSSRSSGRGVGRVGARICTGLRPFHHEHGAMITLSGARYVAVQTVRIYGTLMHTPCWHVYTRIQSFTASKEHIGMHKLLLCVDRVSSLFLLLLLL